MFGVQFKGTRAIIECRGDMVAIGQNQTRHGITAELIQLPKASVNSQPSYLGGMGNRRTRWVVGCMTGTSLDGLDVALVEIIGEGLEMIARCRSVVQVPLGELVHDLGSMTGGAPRVPLDYLRAARRLGEQHAEAIDRLLKGFSIPTLSGVCARMPDFVVAHGQTIWHAPRDTLGALSWQLFDPYPIVRRLRLPVCFNLRQADLVAGGQGAPVTPLADWVLYRDCHQSRILINLGGIANITLLPAGVGPDRIEARDVCPCNLLIDGLVHELFAHLKFDRDGQIARQGSFSAAIHAAVGRHPVAEGSTGREEFHTDWIRWLVRDVCAGMAAEEVVSAGVEAVARWLADAVITSGHIEAVIAGGGSYNRTLVDCLARKLPNHVRLRRSDEWGIACEAREAVAFAVLGAMSQDGVPITLEQVTGASDPGVAGVWVYP